MLPAAASPLPLYAGVIVGVETCTSVAADAAIVPHNEINETANIVLNIVRPLLF
jgi:hypothetical protein